MTCVVCRSWVWIWRDKESCPVYICWSQVISASTRYNVFYYHLATIFSHHNFFYKAKLVKDFIFHFSLTTPSHVTNTTFMENGVKTCAIILDQDNKMNSTRAQDYYNFKAKRRKNVVCQDTVKVPSLSALESLQEVNFCHIFMTHIDSYFLIRKTLNSSKA